VLGTGSIVAGFALDGVNDADRLVRFKLWRVLIKPVL
jgi:hypothetical protein